VHLRTRLKDAPSTFRATRDVMLSASHVAATALLQRYALKIEAIQESENEKELKVYQIWQTLKGFTFMYLTGG